MLLDSAASAMLALSSAEPPISRHKVLKEKSRDKVACDFVLQTDQSPTHKEIEHAAC